MTSFAGRVHDSFLHVWNIVGRNSEQIKIISGIFVAGFVLLEYRDRQEEGRITRALSYVTEHQSEQKMDARVASRLVWQENPEYAHVLSDTYSEYLQFLLAEGVATDGSTALIEQVKDFSSEPTVLDIIFTLTKKHERLENKLHGLQNFYHSVAQCTLSEVCDAQTICQTFFSDVQTFRAVYLSYFNQWGNTWFENKGVVIDEFVKFCDERAYHFAYID